MKITVLGAGAWGTALSQLLHQASHDVTLWGHKPAHLAELERTHHNDRYLPGITLPKKLKVQPDIDAAVENCELVVFAVPSKSLRTVASHLSSFSGTVVSVTKGIEFDTGLTMSGVLAQEMKRAKITALSGPSLALEVARGVPAAVVAASADAATAHSVQQLFHRPAFRVYTSQDIIGVELGGALKNVIAIAAGVCDGLGFGDNSKAALVTRAIVEIRRLGVACGAQPETFAGLSGLGDLTVTCFSKLSRNRSLGERLGKGEDLAHIIFTAWNVAEGYPTACAAYHLAEKLKIDAPIISEVYAMLYEGKNVRQAVLDLTSRDSKSEG